MKRKQWFMVAAAVVIAVASLLYLQGSGTTEQAMSESIPTTAYGSRSVQFTLVLGQPGTLATVTTDIGKLSQSPDTITDDKTIGQVKQMPDSAPENDPSKKQVYKVYPEGYITFGFTGTPSHIGETATITVSRPGDPDKIYHVEIIEELTSQGEQSMIGAIDRIELENATTVENDGVRTLYLRFQLVDQSGEVAALHPDSVLYLHYRIATAGTGAYLIGSYLPDEGDGEGSMAQVQDTEHLVINPGAIEVPVNNISDAPITLQVSITDEDHNEYLSRAISVHANMQL
jgi:hypothetical protein